MVATEDIVDKNIWTASQQRMVEMYKYAFLVGFNLLLTRAPATNKSAYFCLVNKNTGQIWYSTYSSVYYIDKNIIDAISETSKFISYGNDGTILMDNPFYGVTCEDELKIKLDLLNINIDKSLAAK